MTDDQYFLEIYNDNIDYYNYYENGVESGDAGDYYDDNDDADYAHKLDPDCIETVFRFVFSFEFVLLFRFWYLWCLVFYYFIYFWGFVRTVFCFDVFGWVCIQYTFNIAYQCLSRLFLYFHDAKRREDIRMNACWFTSQY